MMPAPYTELMLKANQNLLDHFAQWVFYKGMGFLEKEQWWGKKGMRPKPHEGIDLALFLNNSGEKIFLDEKSTIPALEEGSLIKSMRDYLGTTLIIEHHFQNVNGVGKSRSDQRIISLYGHTTPLPTLYEGKTIKKGEIIATIANKDPNRILPHLHLSTGVIPRNISKKDLVWENLHNPSIIQLKDPTTLVM